MLAFVFDSIGLGADLIRNERGIYVSSIRSVKGVWRYLQADGLTESSLTLFLYYYIKARFGGTRGQKESEPTMLFRITVKNSKLTSGIRVEKGMSVDVPSNSMSNPVTTNGGQAVVDAFMRIYGIDIRKAGALSMAWLDVERIG